MFKAAKWRVDKSRPKVEFRLEFQATHVPQLGWDKLCVSLVSFDDGKTAAKTERASIRNGSCQWSDPIYEAIKLEEDATTGKYEEKLYKLVLSTGSSQFGFLGETTINLIDYIGAISPSTISLPLKSCTSGTILHIAIQRLTEKTGHRDFDRQRHLLGGRHHIIANEFADIDDPDETATFSDGTTNGHGSEENSVAMSRTCLSLDYCQLTSRYSEANGNHIQHLPADAISTSSSGSSYTAKQEMPDIRDISLKSNGTHQDAVSFLSSLSQNSKPQKSVNNTGHSVVHARQPEMNSSQWTNIRNPEQATENDKSYIYKENERLKKCLQNSESTIEELQNEVLSMDRQAEELATEVETLKKQLVKEIKQGQEFATEISSLKIERDKMKSQFEQLKALEVSSEKDKAADKISNEINDARCIIEELKQELDYEKQININLSLQLHKTQESNSELLLAVQDLEELLEQKNREIEEISSRTSSIKISDQDTQTRHLQDIEKEWLQKLSSSEQQIKEITEKITLNSSLTPLEFLQDDLKLLETSLKEAKEGSRNLFRNWNNEMEVKNNRLVDLEYSMQHSSRDSPPFKKIEKRLETKEQSFRNLNFDSDEDERLEHKNSSKRGNVSDLEHLQDKILRLDKVRTELENRNQNLQEETRVNRLHIADLESQLSMVDEEAQALAEANQHLEATIENLEAENLELQNCLHASQEAGKLAHKQMGELMEEMSLLSAKSESESGIIKSTDRQTSEVEEDHGDISNALFNLQKQNGQLLNRIFELEIQQNESQPTAKEKDDELRKIDRKLVSTRELEKKVLEISREAQDYKMAWDYLAKEIEQIEHDYEALKQQHADCASGLSETQLQKGIQMLQDEHSVSLSKINALEGEIKSLQEEIDVQASKFAADLDSMLQLKNAQEKRAQRAEEELRKTRWNNATAVEQIQEEFKRLSRQITTTFDANEKLATQALAEASDLRLQKANLQDALEKAEEEIVSIRERCQENLQVLTTQLDISKKEGEALSSKLKDTLDELEKQKKIEANYISETEELSLKLAMLQTDTEVLRNEKSELNQKVRGYERLKAELEDVKIALDGFKAAKTKLETALQRTNQDKAKLNKELRSLQEKLKNSEMEMNELKHCRDYQGIRIVSLESKLEEQATQISSYDDNALQLLQLRSQYSELEQRLSKKESEALDTWKQISYLQEELQHRADALAIVDRKLKDKEEKLKLHASGGPVRIMSKANSKVVPLSRNVKELSDLRNKVKLLENEVMSKTLALEASREEFNAKEKSLRIKIEELEMISQDLQQNQLITLKNQNLVLLQREKELPYKPASQNNIQEEFQLLQTVSEQLEIMSSNESSTHGKATERVLALEKELDDALDANRTYKKQLQRELYSALIKKEEEHAAALESFRDMSQLVSEMEELKRKNSTMEEELKDMHGRYSQLSLKFAEVEGERQRLVMAIRNLKNAKKA